MDSQSNQQCFLSFRENPSLADALNDINAGDEFKVELTLQCLDKTDTGISCNIVPGQIVPEGFILEENPSGGEIQKTPAPEPPGSLAQTPVTVLTMLRKKGKQSQ